MKFWVPGPLPGMNEIIEAAKGCGGKGYGYSTMKKRWTHHVAMHALSARLPKYTRIRLECLWIEPIHENKSQKDFDNGEAAIKFILDGLKQAKRIPDDKPGHYRGAKHDHELGAKPGVWVTIIDASTEAP